MNKKHLNENYSVGGRKIKRLELHIQVSLTSGWYFSLHIDIILIKPKNIKHHMIFVYIGDVFILQNDEAFYLLFNSLTLAILHIY